MRKRSLFNDDWLFAASKVNLDAPDDQFEPITLPHTNKIFPHNNFDNRDYQFISTYRKRFTLSNMDKGQFVFLDFEGVMLACSIYLNGKLISEHLGGYISFSVNITGALQEEENVITVYVDSTERTDIPPYGHLVDYLTFGGIYRDVYLTIVNPIYIENIFIKTTNIPDNPRLTCVVRLNKFVQQLRLSAILLDGTGNKIAETAGSVENETTTLNFEALPEIRLLVPG